MVFYDDVEGEVAAMNWIIKDKRAIKNRLTYFWAFFPRGKNGMEMWQLILIILAVILLLFMMVWYGSLRNDLGGLFDKMGDLF